MEKQSVEDSFRNAFSEAEMRPSSDVWTHVELGIEKEEGNALKKRVVFYRWMAAASVLLAISLLGVGYFTNSTISQNPIALNSQAVPSIDDAEGIAEPRSEVVPAEIHPSVSEWKQDVKSSHAQSSIKENINRNRNELIKDGAAGDLMAGTNNSNSSLNGNTTVSHVDKLFPGGKSEGNAPPMHANRTQSPLPPLFVQRPYKLYFPKTEPDQIDLLLAAIEMEEKEAKKKSSDRKETLWTSVAMAAGSYSPVIGSSSSPNSPAFAMNGNSSLDNTRVVDLSNQVEASGYSLSSGISVGGKISNRWVLQGGVTYMTQNSNYSSNAILVDAANNFSLASINTMKSEAYSGFQSSNPYTVSSTLKYFNVPLQAGYLIVNKAFGWQMQGGISTDFFLQNTLSAEDAGLDKVSQSGGDESPYRTVNFSGLLGTEVSYRFGEHYRVAINPGLRYPLQSVYKSELGVSAAPITFDVGLKFHYIFR